MRGGGREEEGASRPKKRDRHSWKDTPRDHQTGAQTPSKSKIKGGSGQGRVKVLYLTNWPACGLKMISSSFQAAEFEYIPYWNRRQPNSVQVATD